jgi:hypothetical protein
LNFFFFFGLTLALTLLESLPWAFPFSSHYHLFKGRSRYHLILWTCITLNGMWCIYWVYLWDNIEHATFEYHCNSILHRRPHMRSKTKYNEKLPEGLTRLNFVPLNLV